MPRSNINTKSSEVFREVSDRMLTFRPNFSKNLATVRKQCGLSYNQLGAAIDGTGAALSDIEKDRTTTTMDRFEKLCCFFGLKPEEFVQKKIEKKIKRPKKVSDFTDANLKFGHFNSNLCQNLQTILELLGVSFISLAESAGVSPSTVWRIQTNQEVNVSLPIVERLSISLGIPFEILIGKRLTKRQIQNYLKIKGM